MLGIDRIRRPVVVAALLAVPVAALLSGGTSSAASDEPWSWTGGPVSVDLFQDPRTGKVPLTIRVDEGITVCGQYAGARVEFTPSQLESGVLSHHGPAGHYQDSLYTNLENTVDVELRRTDDVWRGTVRAQNRAKYPDDCPPPSSYDTGTLDVSLERPSLAPPPRETTPRVPRGTGWRVTNIFFGIRCDLSPCRVGGSVAVRLKGAKIPTSKRRAAVFFGLHGPRNFKLRIAGRTIRFRALSVVQDHQVEPFLQYSARAGFDVRGGPWARPATRAGTLAFTTKARKVRKRVTVRFVRVA